MIIQIPTNDLHIIPEWRINSIKSAHIDFADNCVYASFDNNSGSKPIVDLKTYGVHLDNRFHRYDISVGPAGLFIKVINNEYSLYKG